MTGAAPSTETPIDLISEMGADDAAVAALAQKSPVGGFQRRS